MTSASGRVAVVTGAGSGIGRQLAIGLARRGARVVAADIDEEAARAVGDEVGGIGVECDVASASSVSALAAHVHERLGTVSIVACNAGVGPGAPISDMTSDDWSWMLGVNLWGMIHVTHAFLPDLRREGGHLIVTSSMAAFAPNPPLGGYAASKAAITAIAEVLAVELRDADPAVGVTILAPGPTRSSIATSQRHRPEGQTAGLADFALEEQGYDWIQWRDPDEVASSALDAMEAGELYAFSHPELVVRFRERADRIMAGFERAAAQPTSRPPST